MAREWDPDAVKAALDLERIGVQGEKPMSPEQIAEGKYRDAAPFAADVITFLAVYSDSEEMRFKAAKYITDRVIGKVTDEGQGATTDKNAIMGQLLDAVSVKGNN